MKKMVLAYNPVSGDAAFKHKLDALLEEFQRRDCMLLIYRTKRDNSHSFAEFVRAADPEAVLIAGGDGTLHEIINIMMKEKINLPVAILPSGTSNDFASYLGIRDMEISTYFDNIIAGRKRWADLGKIGNEYFVNVASAGMLTAIAHEVDAKYKNAFGKMAYYVRGLRELPRFRSIALKITADGKVYEEDAYLFLVVNSSVVGSLKNVAVKAEIDDGKLDLLVLRNCSLAEIMSFMAELVAGKDVMLQNKNIFYLQAGKITVEAAENIESDLDGECGPLLPLAIETVPKAMEFFY